VAVHDIGLHLAEESSQRGQRNSVARVDRQAAHVDEPDRAAGALDVVGRLTIGGPTDSLGGDGDDVVVVRRVTHEIDHMARRSAFEGFEHMEHPEAVKRARHGGPVRICARS
jgi:hypothetical protein